MAEAILDELSALSHEELQRGYAALNEDLSLLEDWLSNPPLTTPQEIQERLADWEEACQWLDCYEIMLEGERPISTPPRKSKNLKSLTKGV